MKARYDLRKMRVLLVDDEPNMLGLLTGMLSRLGISAIEHAKSAPRALDLVELFNPDLALVDWELGGMSGYDFVKQVRGLGGEAEDTGLFILTGHAEMARVKSALTAGVDDFLAKPVAATTLHRRINRFIDLRPHLKWRFRDEAQDRIKGDDTAEPAGVDPRVSLSNDEISALFD